MPKVVGISFRRAGKIYYFDPGSFELAKDQTVIVETARGQELGKVKLVSREVDESDLKPLKTVVALATPEDERKYAEQQERAKDAKIKAWERVCTHDLPMRLIDSEYTFDDKKLIIYFTAEARVDFRQLVKDLAGMFKIRIELQQIGARDETKIIGALASCGRETCCSLFLREMPPIATKMVKEQNLPLNPVKNAGMCGKLKCCLRYEYETYKEIKKGLPKIGSEVVLPDLTVGLVVGQHILKRTLLIQKPPENLRIEVPASEVKIIKEGAEPASDVVSQEEIEPVSAE